MADKESKLIEKVMRSIDEAIANLRNHNNELESVIERVFGSAPVDDPSKKPPAEPGVFNVLQYHLGHLHEEIQRNQNAIERLTEAF